MSHRYLMPAAITALSTAFVPVAANAAQTGSGGGGNNPIQIQVPASAGATGVRVGAPGAGGSGGNGGIHIRMPASAGAGNTSGGQAGGIHVSLPQAGSARPSSAGGAAVNRTGSAGSGSQYAGGQSQGPIQVNVPTGGLRNNGSNTNGGNNASGAGPQAGGTQSQQNTAGANAAQGSANHLGTAVVSPQNGANGGVGTAGGNIGQGGSVPVAATPGQVSGQPLQNWVGEAVYNAAGQNIGSVHGFVAGNQRQVNYAVIETGSSFFGLIGGKLVAVPIAKLHFNSDNARLEADLTQAQFQQLPAYHPDQQQSGQQQQSGSSQ